MTTLVTIRKGHDVRYFTNADGVGCAGAMAYYTKGGEPRGQWAGRAAARLGLAGQVDRQVLESLFMENIGPGGEVLAPRHQGKGDAEAEEAAVRAWRKQHLYASATEIAEFRAQQRAKSAPRAVPYFDLTVSAVKSVSVLHASYRVAAMQARAERRPDRAQALDAMADAIEQAMMDGARDAVRWLEEHATYTRTGHHSASTGEWRDGDGLASSLFLHHVSRDGDPQLHVHVAVWNRVQRADKADGKWRTLHGRALYQNRLGMAPVPDRFVEARLRDLGFVMVPRPDGNGCEVGGVDPKVMRQFSSRGVAVVGELARLAAEWERIQGKPPSKRTLWLLHQQAGQRTRRAKAEARRTVNGQVHDAELTDAERLAEWEKATTAEEMQALSAVCEAAEEFARERARARGAAAPQPAPGGAPHAVQLPPVPGRILTDEDRRRAAAVAVAEAQRHHAAWDLSHLRFEVHRALGAGVSGQDVTDIAELVVSGRSGTGVVQVGAAPDIADVAPLGMRESDGVSVYRPPGETKWSTLEHLDLEEHIVAVARARMPRLVPEEAARRAVARTDLTAEQREAVVTLLATDTMTVPLNAAAGSGKSHTMAVFARLWTQFTGGRVIGLTTSTNAAEVLANEGLAESYNIAQFLGKVEGSDKLRHPVRVNEGDVLVLDEATQASTVDVALVQQAARHAGARMHPVGDTEQLGSVEAGGIFSLLATDLPGARLEEIRRFAQPWQAEASQRLRKGDIAALAAYQRRGRIRGADHEAVFDKAAQAYLADLLRGRDVLLLAGSSAEAADLSRRVQAQLAQAGRVGEGVFDLADGNMAGVGDLVRARHNEHIDAGGRRLTNRDTLLVMSADQGSGHAWVRRRTADPAEPWSRPFRIPAAYLAEHGELNYAGNVHVSQGRTVGPSHLVVTQTLSRRSFYVGMTRGREENTAWVETGNTAPKGKKPYEQATAESVVKGIMKREAGELSATEQMRAGQEWAGGTGHVMHLWSTAVRESLYPQIDRQVAARLPAGQARRYQADHARQAFHARLREAQLAGHDLGELIDRVTADNLDGARSIASVLHSRLEGLALDPQHDTTWAQRTPEGAPQLARDLAEGLDERVRELGVRQAEKPEPWLTRHLGHLETNASPALRAEYERRAGIAASYREAAGITDPDRAIAPDPHEGNPELETARRATMTALEIRDEAQYLRGLSRAQLEAKVADGDRIMAAAPPDVSDELRRTGQAKADAWGQHADAIVRAKDQEAAQAEQLARLMEAQEATLEPQADAYEAWSAQTAAKREEASKARAELARRGPADLGGGGPDGPRGPGPGGGGGGGRPRPDTPELADEVAWWREFEADLAKADVAIAAEQQEALDAGTPWPPPSAEPKGAITAEEAIAKLRADGYLPPEAAPVAGETEVPTQVEAPAGTPNKPAPSAGTSAEAGDADEADEACRRQTSTAQPAQAQAEAAEPDRLGQGIPEEEWAAARDRQEQARAARQAEAAEAARVEAADLERSGQGIPDEQRDAARSQQQARPGPEPEAADGLDGVPDETWAQVRDLQEQARSAADQRRARAAEAARAEAQADRLAANVPDEAWAAQRQRQDEARERGRAERVARSESAAADADARAAAAAQPHENETPEPAAAHPHELPAARAPEAGQEQPAEGRNARLDQLQARAMEAAGRIEAERAEVDAGARDYAERQATAEADAEPSAGGWQASVPAEEELEPG